MLSNWIEIKSDVDPAFRTHANYIKHMETLTTGLKFDFTPNIKKSCDSDKNLYKKGKTCTDNAKKP